MVGNRQSLATMLQVDKNYLTQLFKYGVVGLLHNGLGYLLFLFVTWLGVSPVVVVAILYPVGTTVSFVMNKQWTFSQKGWDKNQFLRFVFTNILGYLLNLILLYIFSDVLGFPYQIVQLGLIVLIAGFLFLMFKFFVLSTLNKT